MTINGKLEHVDGRKLVVGTHSLYLRKGVDSSQYFEFLEAEVVAEVEEEKGFLMVKEIKPSLPKTEVEKTGPVDMLPSANVPKLDFNAGPTSYTSVTGSEGVKVVIKDNRTQKDHDIMRQWAIGNVLQSHALAQCNDALALNTQQTMERAKRLADELLKWVVTR